MRENDEFSQLLPDEDVFEEIPDEEADAIQVNETDELPLSLARPKFSALVSKPSLVQREDSPHAKKTPQPDVQESVSEAGDDSSRVEESPLAEDSPVAHQSEQEAVVAPVYRYRIALVLSPDIEIAMNQLRQAVQLPDAETGSFALVGDFRTENLADIQEILEEWVQDNLPMELALEGIEAKTVGSQRYVAAWSLTPPDSLTQAQESLADNLAPYLLPDDSASFLPFQSRLILSDHTPARIFPLLVREMQQQFEKLAWRVEALELLRVPEGDSRWEVLEKFN